ncbi:MAG TPA: DUF1343 domain-containing protein [Abditibacteriaceae bacterium]|jgi:uncharacterized protein YbbC (DUF1343 family)
MTDETVRAGVDELAHHETLEFLRGRRCGLVTNHTGIARDGRATLEVVESLGVQITALFSPEHGFHGVCEGKIESTVEFNRPVHSLYGETRRPTPEMLADLDALIFDIFDVGARFYTYSSTMALCLEECARAGIPLVVLDRPNPCGGVRIEGPSIDEDVRSFIGHVRLPIVHGLTMGEIAGLHRADENLVCALHVVRAAGWQRPQLWPSVNGSWVAPSPNLPHFTGAEWYPGACLLEFCDVSVGRGTDTPFQIVGAPWIDAERWKSALDDFAPLLPDYSWERRDFIPTRATHEGVLCHGLHFQCDASIKNIVSLGMAMLASLRTSHPEFTEQQMAKSMSLLGSRAALNFLQRGELTEAIALAHRYAEQFRRKREPFLLY